ncbi:MAG: hypothetical protein QGG42_08005 [Phycisphaerae bacterium]|jgi:hypothetical protein|nr:hypothetical protein [Phycisphaerae bacterium]
MAYLNNSLKITEKYKEVIAFIAKHNPGKEADFDASQAFLVELVEADNSLMSVVMKTQRKVAKKFDLRLETPGLP